MTKKKISDLTTHLRTTLPDFIDAIFSAPVSLEGSLEQPIQKIVIKPVELKGKRMLQIASFTSTQCFTKNVSQESLEEVFAENLALFSQVLVRLSREELHIQPQSDGSLKWKTKVRQQELLPCVQHNRQKRYLLEDGKPVDFLIALGIMNKEGRVYREKYDKFKQINHFLENILVLLPDDGKSLQIIDFGCGKAYLTFALYYMLRDRDVQITGIDLKEELLQRCQNLADRLGYTGLKFVAQSIAAFEPQVDAVDLVLALHACDTATDEALAKACLLKAKAICVAPCCQHEIAKKLKKEASPVLLSHGLLHERFAALLTDAMRAEILKQLGYKTELLEFVDLEHTPKNLLIRAIFNPQAPKPDWTEYRKLIGEYAVAPKLQFLLELNK